MNTGILVLCFCLAAPAAALTLHKAHDRFTPGSDKVLQADDVPVLNITEAPMFFEALHGQDKSKDLAKKDGLSQKAPNVLVVVYGLMRTYKEAWPIVANQMNLAGIAANGGRVDVIVSTDLATRCDDKEINEGRCRGEWHAPNNEQYINEIKETYKPYVRAVFDDRYHQAGGRVLPAVDAHSGFEGAWWEPFDKNDGDVSFLAKLSTKAADPFSKYDHVLAIRTDASFSHDFDIADVCARNPGMNLVHGDYDCSCYIHHADYDKAMLACEPQLMRNYFFPSASCEGLTAPPPIPEGFGGSWYGRGFDFPAVGQADGPGMGECKTILEMQNLGKRLGSLDGDGLFAHIH